ncbi:MAG TPA: hemopexin repeat-containing protein [Mycobacterium sp.]|nr:hemopexin repeat-containing protein [Mycobacterium sp.]
MSKLVSLGWNDEKAYFFSGGQYVRWDVASDTVDVGYPRPISSGWIGIFPDGIDAAAVWNNGKAYFFRGAEYSAYDIAADVVVDGYPRTIAENWPGVFPEGVDAVIVWGNGKAYFFRGDEYLSYDMAADTVDDGYPRPIRDGWVQPFDTGIDSAVVWNNGKAYFFRGDEYVRYDVATEMADEGYPQPISLGWPGARGERANPSRTSPTPHASEHGVHASVRDYFLAFTEPLEGRIYCMYLDIEGYVTTAVGNLIDTEGDACRLPWTTADGTRAAESEIRSEWRLVKGMTELARQGAGAAARATQLRLTDAAIDDLVLAKFDANTPVLRRAYADWDSWPADAQLGCHSILWTGSRFPDDKYWPRFNAAVKTRDWLTAADQSHINDEANPGVTARNTANHELFKNASRVDAQGLDITALVYRHQR